MNNLIKKFPLKEISVVAHNLCRCSFAHHIHGQCYQTHVKTKRTWISKLGKHGISLSQASCEIPSFPNRCFHGVHSEISNKRKKQNILFFFPFFYSQRWIVSWESIVVVLRPDQQLLEACVWGIPSEKETIKHYYTIDIRERQHINNLSNPQSNIVW